MKIQISLHISILIRVYPKCAKWRFWSGYMNHGWVRMSKGTCTFSDVAARINLSLETKWRKNKKEECITSGTCPNKVVFEGNILSFLASNTYCGFTLELHQRGNSNEYRQDMFWWKNDEKYPVNTFPWLLRRRFFFSTKKYLYFSYFLAKAYVVGTH